MRIVRSMRSSTKGCSTQVLTLAASLLLVSATAHAQRDATGRWEGTMRRGASTLPIAVDLPSGAPQRGFFTAGDIGAMDVPLANVRVGAQSHWELVGDRTTLIFDGRAAGDSIDGTITEAGTKGVFALHRVSASTEKPYTAAAVRFNNGNVMLSGTVLSPRSSGKHAAMVFIHGSGAEGRWANGVVADYAARHGIVALIYDKRGVGESTGDWKTSQLDALAGDASAAVHVLALRADVDAQRVGVYGHSQGGFIAPLVAANPEVRWIIDADGNVGPQYEQDLFRVRNALAKRYTGQTLQDALSLYGEFVDVARNGLSRVQLHADMTKHHSAPWFDDLALPDDQDWIWNWYRAVGNADNRRAWRAVNVPVLLLYGENDELVPPRQSIDAISRLLEANHDTAITVRVLAGADHTLRVMSPDPLGWPRYAEGYPEMIVDWIERPVAGRRDRPER
jgi:uncharacterized protein